MNRPDRLNAFNAGLYSAMRDELEAAAIDDGVSVVVVTGAGRAFSAGQDIGEMAELAGAETRPASAFPIFTDALSSFPKPILAAVNGVAVGLGFTMLAHCDLVLVADGARFRAPFTSLGVVPEAGSSYLFPVRMGWQRAARLLFTSEWLDAAGAVEHGIALQVVPSEELLETALTLAASIAAMPLGSLMATKRLLLEAQLPSVQHARQMEDAGFAELLGSMANAEAMQRFLER